MLYQVQPLSREQAVANRQSAASRAFGLFMLTAFGGITAAVGIGFAIKDVTATPAWIATVIGLAAGVAGLLGCATVMSRVRYRITAQWSGVRLVAILGGAGLLIWGLGAAHLISGGVAKGVIGAVAAGALTFHLSTSTLFMGDCNGVMFRKTLVHWDYVSDVVFTAGTEPGTVEIGVRLRPGVELNPMAVHEGQLLTELAFRTVVPLSKFDVDRMCWVVNQSGRQGITLVEAK